jgi:hypothetical protein
VTSQPGRCVIEFPQPGRKHLDEPGRVDRSGMIA